MDTLWTLYVVSSIECSELYLLGRNLHKMGQKELIINGGGGVTHE